MAKLIAAKIHPTIGIARLGNHPTDFFIGPEKPSGYIQEADIDGGFKKIDGEILKIKRQASRFRVFGYYDNGDIIELDSDDAQIEWKVKIANTKGAFEGFLGKRETITKHRNSFVTETSRVPKNSLVPSHAEYDQNGRLLTRKLLILNPDEVKIIGNRKLKKFSPTRFTVYEEDDTFLQSEDIFMGECRTDDKGRLLVLGGFGNSGSVRKNVRIKSYDDNNYWYDDIGDGYVKATIRIKATGQVLSASDSWVIIAPPKYVPHIHPLVSLYDTLYNRFVSEGKLPGIVKPKFYADIYPILLRAFNIKWLFKMPSTYKHSFENLLNPKSNLKDRQILFMHIRKPDGTGGRKAMPKLFGDDYRLENGENNDINSRLTLTAVQYKILEDWKNGNFEIDSKDVLNPPKNITAAGLDKVTLENCIGGGFFPGIETSWKIRDEYQFIEDEPFRLDSSKIQPGDLTKQNALPWQADFLACSKEEVYEGEFIGWWPYARPDDVFAENEDTYHTWTPPDQFSSYEDMVEKWKYLGIIVERKGKFIEVQRQFPPSNS